MTPFQIFDVREPTVPAYQVPPIDILSEGAVVLPAPAAAPVLLRVAPGELVWKPSPDATGYLVEKREGTLWQKIAERDADEFTDAGNDELSLVDAAVYTTTTAYFRVVPTNAAGRGHPSGILPLVVGGP